MHQPTKNPDRQIAVFGAYGHTARFVIAELLKRGWTPILSGRDAAKLSALANKFPELETRVASIDDPASLDRAFAGTRAILNCAGPFADTAPPVIEAALRARIHYLDIAAEQPAVLNVFERFSPPARDAKIVVVPAMAFYGGLADLLATAAMADWTAADEILIATALDSWHPTEGTRRTGQRNPGQHVTFSNNKFDPSDPAPRTWNFPPPFNQQDVVGLSLAETITISRHLAAPEIHAYVNLAPLTDLRNPNTPAPKAVDATGRSAQLFVMDVIVRKGIEQRRATATGQDIYAVTAPLVVEAAERVIKGTAKITGVVAAGQAFDARDFLTALTPAHVSFESH